MILPRHFPFFLAVHFLFFSMSTFSPSPYPVAMSSTPSLSYPPPSTGGIYSNVAPAEPTGPSDTFLSYPQFTPTSSVAFPDNSSFSILDSTILSVIIETSSPTPDTAALPSTSLGEAKNLKPLAGYIGQFLQSPQAAVNENC